MRHSVKSASAITGAALMALAVSGCGSVNSMSDTLKSDAGWFSKPITSVFSREDGSGSVASKNNFSLGPSGPVPPEELINPDGSCAAPASAAAQPSDRAVGSMAGDLAGSSMPAAAGPGDGALLGGVALGMTECQTVWRAGMPSNVAITAGDNNERKTVLTYIGGQWPGIYTFASGRLKVIDAVPVAERPKPTRRAPARRS